MSGPIRRVLGPARARAKTLIDKPIDKYDTAANAAKTPQERIQEVNRVKLSINHDMDKLQNAINYLHEKDTQWQNLFPSLGPDEKPAEEKEYARHSDMSDGHLTLIFNGQDKLSDMKSHVQELDNLKSQFEQEITQKAIAAAQVPVQAPVQPAPAAAAPVAQLKLPKIELPFFDGDPANWLPFWDIFEGAVHNQNISGGQKLAYLNSKLTKSALNAVTGLPVTNDNYQVAVDILKKRFGQPAVIRNALITKLGDLKISSSSPRELRSTQDYIEKTLRQLEALNEDIEQPILADILKRKLPADILTEMQRLKATADAPWTVVFIRQSLGTVIEAREEIQQVVQAQSSTSKSGQQGFKPASGQSFQSRSNSPVTTTTGSLSTGIQPVARGRGNPRARVNARGAAQSGRGRSTASSQGSPGAQNSAQTRISCAFCGKNHYSSSCSNFPTVDSRRTQITKLRDTVCMKCLRTGHMARNCTRYVKCYHCKSDRHNTAFCPKQYSGNQSVSSSVTDGATEQRGSASGQSQVDSVHAQPTHLAPVSVTVDADRKIIANQAQSRTKSSMLMTARAMVSNPNSPSYTAPVQIFFDNGAQRTFIKASLKDRLGLHTNSQQELLIYTFGSPRPHYKKCDHVSFDLLLKDGSHFPIEADSIPHLTAAQTRPTLCKEDKGFIQKYFSAELFADTVPFDSTPFDPDIIVGEDYFWDFMEDFPKIKLQAECTRFLQDWV